VQFRKQVRKFAFVGLTLPGISLELSACHCSPPAPGKPILTVQQCEIHEASAMKLERLRIQIRTKPGTLGGS
jgi:hypothetical protein